MARITKPLLVVLVFVSGCFAEKLQLRDVEFMSPSLGHTMHYRILLPAIYNNEAKKFPVLYLLHGLYGDYKNWTDKTAVANYAAGVDLIIVMPDANDSWYTNWATDPQQKYESYIIKDLLEEIDGHYRTLNTRDSRWIAGLSMGGYAALKFALKYPQLFSVAASFSGAFDAPSTLAARVPAFAPQLQRVYGSADDRTRAENDIFRLSASADPTRLPYFYITCGTADGFLATNRDFVAALPERKFYYEYHEFPGSHDWIFWERSLRDFLRDSVPKLPR